MALESARTDYQPYRFATVRFVENDYTATVRIISGISTQDIFHQSLARVTLSNAFVF